MRIVKFKGRIQKIKCEGCGIRFEHITPCVVQTKKNKKRFCDDCLRKRSHASTTLRNQKKKELKTLHNIA